MDRTLAEVSGFAQGVGLVRPRFCQHNRNLVAYRAVRPFLVVVSTPEPQFFGHDRKCPEPVLVQTFRTDLTIECWMKALSGDFQVRGGRE